MRIYNEASADFKGGHSLANINYLFIQVTENIPYVKQNTKNTKINISKPHLSLAAQNQVSKISIIHIQVLIT